MAENTQIIDKWVRPWDKERTDDLYQKDERYFSVLIKGILAYLTKNIISDKFVIWLSFKFENSTAVLSYWDGTSNVTFNFNFITDC